VAARGGRRVAARGEPPLIATLPSPAVFVPGISLAGVRLGDTQAQVRRHVGSDYGVCRGCTTTTWYFTYRRFHDEGIAVEFSHRRVSAAYTLWKPPGFRGPDGLRLGALVTAVKAAVPGALPIACANYTTLRQGRSVYLIVAGRLWGFGLFRKGRSPCR
jgi:hypothetical protein